MKVLLAALVSGAAVVGVALAIPSQASTPMKSVNLSQVAKAATIATPITDLGVQTSNLSTAQVDEILDDTQAAGATVISTAAAWYSMQPTPLGSLNFTSLDQLVADVRGRGMKVRLQLETLPLLDRDSLLTESSYWDPPRSSTELSKWAGFVNAVVTHFKGTVAYYEVWNEPNISEFWPTGPNPTEFARLLQTSYTTIKAADPAATVISGGLSRNDVGFATQTYAAMDSMYGAAAKASHYFFDLMGVHPYDGDRAPSTVAAQWAYQGTFGLMDENYTGFTKLHDLMTAHGESTKGIYFGEFGYSTTAMNGFNAVPDATRATYLTSAYSIAAKYTYVKAMSWYYTHVSSAADTSSWALINSDYSLTQTYAALVAHAKAAGQVK